MQRAWIGIIAAVALAVVGCSSDPMGPLGPLPQISNLASKPQALSVNSNTTISGQFDFYAPGGDLVYAFVQVTDPSGQVEPLTRIDATGSFGELAGTLGFTVSVHPDVPGVYRVSVWVKDSQGQNSNSLTAELPAS
jgi:hypothetical protein